MRAGMQVADREVAALAHEVSDDTVECGALQAWVPVGERGSETVRESRVTTHDARAAP